MKFEFWVGLGFQQKQSFSYSFSSVYLRFIPSTVPGHSVDGQLVFAEINSSPVTWWNFALTGHLAEEWGAYTRFAVEGPLFSQIGIM